MKKYCHSCRKSQDQRKSESTVYACTLEIIMAFLKYTFLLSGLNCIWIIDQEQKRSRLDKSIIPLSLEDSCLVWLIIDQEHYPPELLALLPLRLHYCLLSNPPVLDLCQFEYAPVAVSVHLDSIWRMKFPPCMEWCWSGKHFDNQNLSSWWHQQGPVPPCGCYRHSL